MASPSCDIVSTVNHTLGYDTRHKNIQNTVSALEDYGCSSLEIFNFMNSLGLQLLHDISNGVQYTGNQFTVQPAAQLAILEDYEMEFFSQHGDAIAQAQEQEQTRHLSKQSAEFALMALSCESQTN